MIELVPASVCMAAVETLMNAVTEMQNDFPQRKAAFDAELDAMDQQIASLNNLMGW